MPIDLNLPGSPSAVRALADWADDVREPLASLDEELGRLRGDSQVYWEGRGHDAWYALTGDLRSRIEPIPDLLASMSSELHSYAGVLERAQGDLLTLRDLAADRGLPTRGTVVLEPPPPAHYHVEAGVSQETVDHDLFEFQNLTTAYEQVVYESGMILGALEAWIGAHILPLLATAQGAEATDDLVEGLVEQARDLGIGLTEEYLDTAIEKAIELWRTAHAGFQDAADSAVLQMAAGNPGFRMGVAAADPSGLGAAASSTAEAIGHSTVLSNSIEAGGIVTEVVLIGLDVQNGGSLSSDVVGAVGGGLGTSLIFAGAATGPPGWVVVGTSMAVGATARFGYEMIVPKDSREAIDDFFVGYHPALVDKPIVDADDPRAVTTGGLTNTPSWVTSRGNLIPGTGLVNGPS